MTRAADVHTHKTTWNGLPGIMREVHDAAGVLRGYVMKVSVIGPAGDTPAWQALDARGNKLDPSIAETMSAAIARVVKG